MSVFSLPLHLVSPLNGSHGHWSASAKRRKTERQAACFIARGAGVRALEAEAEITVRIVRVAPRELDDDNLRGATKSVRDGLADALGLKSDRDPRVTWEYGQAKGPSSVEVEIREHAVDEAHCPNCGRLALVSGCEFCL